EPAPVQTEVVFKSVRKAPAVNPDSEFLQRLSSFPSAATQRELAFRVFPQNAVIQVSAGNVLKKLHAASQSNDMAYYNSDAGGVLISSPGYESLVIDLSKYSGSIEAKLERATSPLTLIAEIPSDYQPKSVKFSPDGKSIFVANLGDFTALSQFRLEPFSKVRNFHVPERYRKDSGFVETLILAERNEIWVSQMTLNIIHIFDIDSGDYLAGIPLSGKWPKVLLASADGSRVYASCWDSNNIIEIDTDSRRELRSFHTSGTPRGMAFSPDGKDLLTAIFSSSEIDRISLETGRLLTIYDAAPGRAYAMRHIVYDEIRRNYYITAMGAKRVYKLSENGEWLGWWDVGDKPNTCGISPDGSRLFVSCRGPNNPEIGYLYKGYEYGKVFIINLESGEVEDWIWGRDQPTGLDVSPDGEYLVFSDFLSHNLELYQIND
ncbi:MAG: YncE family protein, partial [Spirochaetaceae bacterium]|nr:YncE family protein [Spirochaetaceae bacterium]